LNRNSVPNYTFIKQQLTTRTSFYFLSIVFFCHHLLGDNLDETAEDVPEVPEVQQGSLVDLLFVLWLL